MNAAWISMTLFSVNSDAADPAVQPSGSRTLSHQAAVDHESPEDPRVDAGLDDEDYSGDHWGSGSSHIGQGLWTKKLLS